VSNLLPESYRHRLAKVGLDIALRGILGHGASMSAASIARLKAKWQAEYVEWKKQYLASLQVVSQWADRLYVPAGLEKDKKALLVIIGVHPSGQKVILA